MSPISCCLLSRILTSLTLVLPVCGALLSACCCSVLCSTSRQTATLRLAQVKDLLIVAGASAVRCLWTTGAYVRQLSPFSQLSTLHLQLSSRDKIVKVDEAAEGIFLTTDMTCLSSLVGLRELHIGCDEEPILLSGLHVLAGVTSLQLVNILPGTLPYALSDFSMGGNARICGELFEVFDNIPEYWDAELTTLSLVMHPFGDDPASFECMDFARSVPSLHLQFLEPQDSYSSTSWCAGHFSQLHHIHIAISDCPGTFRPDWDFSTCQSIETFTLYIDGELAHVQLELLRNLCTSLLQVEFGSRCVGSAVKLACSTWTVSEATILYVQPELGCCPPFVSHAQAAVGSALGGLSQCKVIAK